MITGYLCDILYDITIEKYRRYVGFSSKVNTLQYYNHSDKINKQLGFTVADILKYYYYTHKDVDNHGFVNMKSSDAKDLWSIINKSLTQDSTPSNIPLGTCIITEKSRWRSKLFTIIKLLDIKNHKVKWDYDNFFNSIILMNLEHLTHSKCAQNLVHLYLYGTNTIIPSVIVNELEEPMSLIEVIEEYENKKNHMVVFIKNKINNKLKKAEKEELNKYQKIILDRGFMTSNKHHSDSSRIIDRVDHKMMSYPLFAFRNIYVQDWIPEESLKILKEVIESKVSQQSNTKLKYYIEKQGKYIDMKYIPGNDYMFYDKEGYSNSYRSDKRIKHSIERSNRHELIEATQIALEKSL